MFNTSIANRMKKFSSNSVLYNSLSNYPTLKSSDKDDKDIISKDLVIPLHKNINNNILGDKKNNVVIDYKNDTYGGIEKLKKLPIEKIPLENEVEICIYQIKYFGNKPVLLFNLAKKRNTLHWPVLNAKDVNFDNMIDNVKKYFKIKDTFLTYEGVFTHAEKPQIWFRYSDDISSAQLCKYSDEYIWCLCSEIVNDKKYLNISIDNNVVSFFIKNPDFLHIKNNLGNIYDTPIVGFYGNCEDSISYTSVFGRTRSAVRRYGEFYYFGTYEQAMRFSIWTMNYKPLVIANKSLTIDKDGKYVRGGLVRFVLFFNNTKIFLDRKTDPILDKKKNIYKDDSSYATFIRVNTQKVRDSKGMWTEKYDSTMNGYINKTINDKDIHLKPLLVVKNYDQQIPISYYFVDTKQKNAVRGDTTHELIVE